MIESLSDREFEILKLMSAGLTNREIGDKLSLSHKTVKWHNTRIFRKLGVRNRREAVAIFRAAREQGRHSNLPVSTSRFIGRKREKAELIRWLTQPACRLVTLLGPGGMGKTWLAQAVAAELHDHFPNGVYYVQADEIKTADELARAIIKQLDYMEPQANDLQRQLIEHLRPQTMLFVFDSCEDALDCVPFITNLLQAAGRIKILVTSRRRLSLHAETVYPLFGMRYPTDSNLGAIDTYDAVQLFEDTARRLQPDWQRTPANSQAIIELCRLTDGMPLGIVLAANWLNVADVARISAEVQQDVNFLNRDLADIPPRQHSIRVIFDETWKYLSPDEQQTFMALSIFRGGFTLAAAEAVTGTSLATLQNLVNKALLYRDTANRFNIHNLLRQYGEEYLRQQPNIADIAAAHARFFTDCIRAALADFQATEQREALDAMETDYDNICLAWNWAIHHRDYTLLQDLIEGLYIFGFTRLHHGKLFLDGLAVLGSEPDLAWAHLTVRSWDSIDQPQRALRRVLPMLHDHGDSRLTAACLQALAWLSYDLDHDPTAAIAYHQQTLAIFRELDDKVGQLNVLCNLGLCSARLGDLSAADDYYQQGRLLHQTETLDYTFLLALTAEHALFNSDFGLAARRYERALNHARKIKVPWGELWNAGCLGLVKLLCGDLDAAREMAAGSELAHGRRHSDQLPARVLLGMLASLEADYETAWRYCDTTSMRENIHGYSVLFLGQIGRSIAACGLEVPTTARELIHTVWHTVDYSPALRVLCLQVIAWLYNDCEQPDVAVEVLSLATHHPQAIPGWLDEWPLFTTLHADLKMRLPPVAHQAAWERGKVLTLDAVELP